MNSLLLLTNQASAHVKFFNSDFKSNKVNLRAYQEEGQIFFSRKKPVRRLRDQNISALWNSVHSSVRQMDSKYYVGLLNFNKFVLRKSALS